MYSLNNQQKGDVDVIGDLDTYIKPLSYLILFVYISLHLPVECYIMHLVEYDRISDLG